MTRARLFGDADGYSVRFPEAENIEEVEHRQPHHRREYHSADRPAVGLRDIHEAEETGIIGDDDLAAYYDALALITRGDLFDPDRLRAIWDVNTGKYGRALLEQDEE